MKRLLIAVLLAAVAPEVRSEVLLLPLAAAEPAPAGRHEVSIGVGLVEPVSKVRLGGGSADNGDLGLRLGARWAYLLTPRLGAGLEADYLSRSGTLSTRLYPAADARVAGDTWLMLAILRWSPRAAGAARPFLLLGAGGAWNKTTVDVRPSSWADTGTRETRRLVDDSAWTPAASARLGVDVDLDPASPGFFTFEAGWTGLAGARYRATPRGEALGISGVSGPLHMLSFSARHGWRF